MKQGTIQDVLLYGEPVLADTTSIIVLQHKMCELTSALVASIYKYTTAKYELILVDNGSDDPLTTGYLDSISGDNVKVLKFAENRGFAKAVNEAIWHSEGEYICLLNNDCQVTPGWLTKLTQACKDHPCMGAISAMTTARDQLVYYGRWSAWPVNSVVNVLQAHLPMIPFTCTVFPAKVIEQIGLLDTAFFIYGEDDDYCMRLKQAGLTLAVHTGVTIKHLHGQTAKLLKVDLGGHKAKARVLLTEKYGDQWQSA